MAQSLKVAHLPRYKSIATLLVKHWRAEGLKVAGAEASKARFGR